jgi:hypothetical protein
MYKVVQIWPGQTVTCLHTNRPGYIWTTLYLGGYISWVTMTKSNILQAFFFINTESKEYWKNKVMKACALKMRDFIWHSETTTFIKMWHNSLSFRMREIFWIYVIFYFEEHCFPAYNTPHWCRNWPEDKVSSVSITKASNLMILFLFINEIPNA